jgi:hypothetical protein
MRNNRLPCPANPKLDVNKDQNFGEEARDGNCTLPEIPSEDPKVKFYRGVIPGRALGLSGDRLLDAWDRQFTYVVVREATAEDSFTSQRWPPTFKLFRPIDNQHNQLRRLNPGNEGIVVIISHGANGSGAYLTDGQQTDPQGEGAGRFEKKNIDADSDFVQAPYSTNERNPFDDQVLVLTEDQIVQPLANQGALQTKQAQILERLKRIENALIGFIVTHSRKKCSQRGGVLIPPADNQGEVLKDLLSFAKKEDVYDPWGQPIQYNQ